MITCKTYFYMKMENQTDYCFQSGRPYWVLDYYKNSMTLLDSGGSPVLSEPSSVYLIPPYYPTQHISTEQKPWVHTTIAFDADRSYMDSLGIPYLTPIFISDTKNIEQLLFDMESHNLSASKFKQSALDAYLMLVLIYTHDFLNTYENDYKTDSGDDLQQVRHVVMNSTHIPWTLEYMAAQANMSVRSFTRKYKQIYGKSPIADLYDFRFTRAKRLLDNGFSINYILKTCGFKSPQHFSAFFKQRAGMTPKEYKSKTGDSHTNTA